MFCCRAMKKIKIAQFGLGDIGIETLKLAAGKPWIEVVAALDDNPAKIGRPLTEITGDSSLRGAKVWNTHEELPEKFRPDIFLHTTGASLTAAAAQIESILRAGINVISSCEELIFPQLSNPELAVRLDKACKDGHSRLLAVGATPALVMNVLPLCLTGACRALRAVHIQRVVNASVCRASVQKKIGSGLPPSEFERQCQASGSACAALKQSLVLLAHGFGGKISDLSETCKAIVAHHDIRTHHVEARRGQTCGLHQHVQARLNGGIILELDLKIFLDAPNPHDACQIDGDPPLNFIINGGIPNDTALVALLVNYIPRVLHAPPGLLLMTDVGIAAFA